MTADWYSATRDYTLSLVRARSVSPSAEEDRASGEVLRLLHEGGLADAYTLSGLDEVAGDPHGRHNAYALLLGRSRRTVVLLGHVDTVGTADYGPLEPWALDPDGLHARRDALARLVPDLAHDLAASPADWMLGRGVADMKSGVAATIAVMRRLAALAREGRLPLSVVLLATVDEEVESAGVLQAVRLLRGLRDRFGLAYAGAINTDYTAARYPGDPHRYIYTGTVGKLLPSLFVVGRAAHAGDPFAGLDATLLAAELVRDLSMNIDLCDRVPGHVAPPPVTLRAADLKEGYDTQLPLAAHLYLNVVTLTTTPAELLELLRWRAGAVLDGLLARLAAANERWVHAREPSPPDPLPLTAGEGEMLTEAVADRLRARQDRPSLTLGEGEMLTEAAGEGEQRPAGGAVLTYAELRAEVAGRLGEGRVDAELAEEWARQPASLDGRERCLRLVRRLWALGERQGPAVVLYYSPPYYPHVAPAPSPLHAAVAAVAAAHPELNLIVGGHFPLLSDLSYLRLDPTIDLAALRDNMPVWQGQGPGPERGLGPGLGLERGPGQEWERGSDAADRPGGYSLPLEAMRAVDMPVVNLGPYGRDVHQPGERVLMSYSFGALPGLIYETIERLAQLLDWAQAACR